MKKYCLCYHTHHISLYSAKSCISGKASLQRSWTQSPILAFHYVNLSAMLGRNTLLFPINSNTCPVTLLLVISQLPLGSVLFVSKFQEKSELSKSFPSERPEENVTTKKHIRVLYLLFYLLESVNLLELPLQHLLPKKQNK